MTRSALLLILVIPVLFACGGGGGGGEGDQPGSGPNVRLDGGDGLSVFPQGGYHILRARGPGPKRRAPNGGARSGLKKEGG